MSWIFCFLFLCSFRGCTMCTRTWALLRHSRISLIIYSSHSLRFQLIQTLILSCMCSCCRSVFMVRTSILCWRCNHSSIFLFISFWERWSSQFNGWLTSQLSSMAIALFWHCFRAWNRKGGDMLRKEKELAYVVMPLAFLLWCSCAGCWIWSCRWWE